MNTNPEFMQLCETVAHKFDITVSQLYARTKKKHIVYPRQIITALSRTGMGFKCEKMAEEFNLHHATVIHSTKKIAQYYKYNSFDRKKINEIIKEVFPLDEGDVALKLIKKDK